MTRPLADAEVDLFPNSFQSKPLKTLRLAQVLEDISTERYHKQINRLQQIRTQEGKLAYDRAKSSLAAATFCGTFSPTRGVVHLQAHSGIVLGDLDHLADVVAAKRAISSDPCTAFVFISPSATGLKVGVHAPVVLDDPSYKHAWQVVATVYETRYSYHWDPSGKDVSRLCYVSFDPDLYVNLNAEIFDVPPMPIQEPRPQTPRRTPTPLPHYNDHDYAERAIQTAIQMIQSAPLGTRHHTRLKAARLLGGYVAGGLLGEESAYGALAQALVGHTEDLQRALRTIEDGLAYGQAHPITIEALEAERQAWLETHRPTPTHRQAHQPDGPTADNNPWEGTRTLPIKPYRGRRLRKWVRHG